MTETPWTPGPWRAGNSYEEFWGLPILAGPEEDPDSEVYPDYICGMNGDDARTDPNGRLIALAPEMAELLERIG